MGRDDYESRESARKLRWFAMNGRHRLAGAGLEGNPAGRSNPRKVRASQSTGEPKRGQARAYVFQRRENQSGNSMFSGRFIRARPVDHLSGVVQGLAGDLPASQHACHLVHAFRRSQALDGGIGLAVAGELADQ